MTRFYFHLVENDTVLSDEEGFDLPDAASARQRATQHIREMIGHEVRESGEICLLRSITISDGGGCVDRVAFAEAVTLGG